MNASPELIRIARYIEDEASLLKRFVALLGEEQALLVEGKVDALMALAEQKGELYRQLQRLHDDRALLLGRMGRPNSESTIRELCRNLPNSLARWDEILQLARTAQERNRVNGKLITERLQSNQAALAVLLAATERPQLYGADGHARPTGGGRHLGSA